MRRSRRALAGTGGRISGSAARSVAPPAQPLLPRLAKSSSLRGGYTCRAAARWHNSLAADTPSSPRSAKISSFFNLGGSRMRRRLPAFSAAHAGTPKIFAPAIEVSMPSPTPSTPSSLIGRSVTTPNEGPSAFFGFGICALPLPSSASQVRWIPPVGSPVAGSRMSATIAGRPRFASQSVRSGWNNRSGQSGRSRPRLFR
jgi:hypothetical protein